MPTTLVNTTSFGVEKVKMRWGEPYVTEGLNKKLHGVVPRGILRGGLLETNANGLEVKINADPISGDVVASYVDDDGHQTTIDFGTGSVVVDMTGAAGTIVYLCLYVGYTAGSDTVVEWRSYSESELFGGSPVAEAGNVVIFGKVNVPGTGPIPSGNVTHEHRRDAWEVQSGGLIPWQQMVNNGNFNEKWSNWTILESANAPLTLSTSSPYEGYYCASVTGNGIAGTTSVAQTLGFPVKPGELLRVRAVAAESGSWVDGSGAFTGLKILFGDIDGVAIGTGTEVLTFTTGSSAWKVLEDIIEVPAGAYYAYHAWMTFDSGATNVATIKVDSIQVFRQQPDAQRLVRPDDGILNDLWKHGLVLTHKPIADFDDKDTWAIIPDFPGSKLQIAHSGASEKPVEITSTTPLHLKHNLAVDTVPPVGYIGIPNICQAWAKIDLAGTSDPVVDDAYNFDVTTGVSITREGVGQYRFTFLDAMPNSSYVVLTQAYLEVSTKPVNVTVIHTQASYFDIYVYEWNSGTDDWDPTDNTYIDIMVAVFGRRT